MSELEAAQQESRRMFERLLRAGGRASGGLEAAAAAPKPFSPFDVEQAPAAAALALGLAIVAAAAPTREEGLAEALAHADRAAAVEDPELVQHALSLFVTHSEDGRRLVKPRSVTAAPRRFAPSSAGLEAVAEAAPGGSTGDERRLDFWREDPLANEHHEHWHEVYPWPGLFPGDWLAWARDADRDGVAELLEGLDPAPDWRAFVANSTPVQIRNAFLQRANNLVQSSPQGWNDYLDALSVRAYGTLRHLNDRQGELFFYMHEQMLARYEAERLAHGLPKLDPLDDFATEIHEGYDPGPVIRTFDGFMERTPGKTIADEDRAQLEQWGNAIATAIDNGEFLGNGAAGVDIDRTNIGENVEGAESRLRPQFRAGEYPGTHNPGHVFISTLSEPNAAGDRIGVMLSPRTAIRDPVFWRWHKYIDDLNFAWQEMRRRQTRAEFEADAPAVALRASLGDDAAPWASPDVILCRTADLPGHDADDFLGVGGKQLGERAFGGDAWERDFSEGEAQLPDGTTIVTPAELTTALEQRELVIEPPDGITAPPQHVQIEYVTHEPFCCFLRVESLADHDVDVTVRIFIAPDDDPDEPTEARRAWIELDKFIHTIPARQRVVVFRPDVLSSVIKKPADVDPANPVEPQPGGEDGGSYCQCGWPYSMLLPRGTDAGMPFRLLVLLTDAAADLVPQSGHCGSMSFCGAVDRYPDSRDMGYPFARPFEESIADTFMPLRNAAGRRFTIRRR